LFLNKSVVIIKNYHCYNNSGDTVSHNGILNMDIKRMDWPMLYTGNPVVLQPGMVFFMHMILMDSENELAMNLGETYLITPSGNERLGKKKLDLVIG